MNRETQKSIVSLFSGAGGLDLGFEQAGFNVVFASDIDIRSCDTYLVNRKIDRNRVFAGDVNTLNANFGDFEKYFKDVDVVCGGPPCQGFSIANQQRIIDDPRNNLYRAYVTFVSNVKPKFFVMENVRGMASKMTEIIQDFKNALNDEYDIAYAVLNAKNYGVPQNRERLFVIGNCVGVSSQQIFEDMKKREYANFTLGDAILDLPELKAKKEKNNSKVENDDCGYVEKIYEYEKTEFYKYINGDREIYKLYNHKNRYNNDRDIKIFSLLPQGGNSLHPSIADIMPYTNRNHIFKDKYYKLKVDEVCRAITAHMKFDCHMYIHPTQARGLSPREAARVQTFPDDYIFTGAFKDWYTQIGNAVPVKLAKAIGEQIIKWI